ncbi:MAG: hypothetical protein LBV71_00355 [Prevotella sp.]|jgi:hypothetical protein|nr:hypothetical protein [Prevotella sp.]
MKAEEIELQLRSEKVRNIVGEIPSTIMRYGLYIIIMFVSVIFFCLSIIPIREQYTTDIVIKSIPENDIITSPIDGQINYSIDDNRNININEEIGRIINNDTTCIIYSKISGMVIRNQKNKTHITQDDILYEIKPNYTQYLYGEILVPIDFINKDYNSFDVEIVTREGNTVKGEITHIYEILVNEGSDQSYKADILIDSKASLQINLICKAIVTIKSERLINKIFR